VNPIGDKELGTIAAWLNGLSQRQDAISNNIANIDTPGYQRQDVAFETALQRQIGAGSQDLTTTDPRHITAGSKMRNTLGIDPAQTLTSSRLDQNNVDIDQEMISLSDTQMRYQAASTALTQKLSILRDVIRS
jgi:flagellar basal-body rod protein FlgB